MTTARNVVARLVKNILASDGDYTLSVNDGMDWTVVAKRNYREIMDALATTDMDVLRIRKRDNREKVGDVMLIWCNGEDVISDHSDNEITTKFVNNVLKSFELI